jgi:trans-aconitate methyltransferase
VTASYLCRDDDIIDWVKAQAMDPVIKPFIKYVRERRKPKAADVGTTPLLATA